MKRLLVLSDDNTLIKSFINYYKDSSFYCVVIYDGKDMDLNQFDGIIIDFFMQNNDWYSVLKKIKNSYVFIIVPDLIVNIKKLLNKVPINYVFHKPFSMEFLEGMLNYYFYDDIKTSLSYKREIYMIFKELGFSFKLLGTKYLFYMLSLVLSEDKEIDTNLYYLTSNYYNEVADNVIKDVSYAIEKCFDNGENYELKEKIFGYTTKKDSGTVKNLTFIYNIYVYILYCLPDEEILRR
jgi:hypothetical protein